MNRYEKLKSKYPLYHRKTKGWQKKQELLIKKIRFEKNIINYKIFNSTANRLDENINKLFKLL